jgi:hypothetical protein
LSGVPHTEEHAWKARIEAVIAYFNRTLSKPFKSTMTDQSPALHSFSPVLSTSIGNASA